MNLAKFGKFEGNIFFFPIRPKDKDLEVSLIFYMTFEKAKLFKYLAFICKEIYPCLWDQSSMNVKK